MHHNYILPIACYHAICHRWSWCGNPNDKVLNCARRDHGYVKRMLLGKILDVMWAIIDATTLANVKHVPLIAGVVSCKT